MFRGVQHISMDAKGRLAVPSRHREALTEQAEGQIVVTIDTQSPCLSVYPIAEWDRIEQILQGLPSLNPAVKRFQRLMLGYAADIQIDSNGRMLLPPSLREYARLCPDTRCRRFPLFLPARVLCLLARPSERAGAIG